MLSELLMATAKANVLLLELIGLFDIPFRWGKPLFFSQKWLKASRFLRFLVKAFSGLAMSLMEGEEDASDRIVKDLDFPS